MILDLRFQYLFDCRGRVTSDCSGRSTTRPIAVNFGNPTGNRLSSNFLVPVRANSPRTMQLGVRYTF